MTRAQITLGAVSVVSAAAIYYTHYIQKKDIADMRIGIERDIAREKRARERIARERAEKARTQG